MKPMSSISSKIFVAGGVMASLLASHSALAEQKSRDQRKAGQEVYVNLGDEPPSMDPTKQADTVSAFWLGHIFEGLMTYDKAGNVVPGTAESMKVSDDKKTYTFKIRGNAKWQDGVAVKAQDFVFTWRRLVDPTYASEYSFIATSAAILNAEEILAKKLPKEQLGVKAIDDSTLEVKLSHPVPYFDSLMAFQVFFPVREDLVKKFGEKFAVTPESMVGNGPFKLVSWSKEQSMRLEKAPTYWNAAAIKITAIENPAIVKDLQANFNNFQTGGVDVAGVGQTELIKQAQDAKLKIETYLTGCIDFIEINTREGRPFASKDLRLAVRDGISRNEFISKIVGTPGYKPAFGIIPDYMPASKPGSTYRKEAPFSFKDADTAGAKKLVESYLKSSKQAKVPSFTILAGDSSRAKKYVEYYQNELSKLLKTEVKVETVPFKTRLQKTRDHQFDLVMGGWCPDYRDAMTFADLYTTKNENNNSGFSSKEYDSLIEQAANEVDLAKRTQIFAKAEKLLAGEAPIVTEDLGGNAYVVSSGLQGVVRRIFSADPDFRYAEWTAGKASH